ncbi:MAG: tyrosine-protein phosphatase [Clostridia bacterium]|nr:tyrosine-protein phosphatase [Clostridia bacterium]
MIKLISPKENVEVSILTAIQKEFIRREYGVKKGPEVTDEDDAYLWLTDDLRSSRYLTLPASVVFKWQSTDALIPCKFELSTSPDFVPEERIGSIATLSDIFTDATEPDVYCVLADNLLSGTRYYWRVTAGEECLTSSFSTVRGEMRFIRAGVVKNLRDMGGRINENGQAIRQGLVYRGGEADPFAGEKYACDEGRRIMLRDLAIKSDVDLRYESEKNTVSPIGESVSYNFLPIHAYGGTLNDEGRASVRRVIEFIADEKNYPVFYHCVAGADRTGTIGMYLDAILDMADDDIILNYNITSLTDDSLRNWCGTEGNKTFIDYLEEVYPELSVKERLMANLRLSGISEETLQKIRDNLLE